MLNFPINIMDLKEDGLCNSSSLERRLRLRKDKRSADNKAPLSNPSNDECKKNNTTQSQCDDSILDFKSPKRVCSMQSKIANSNRPVNKSKKKILIPKSKVINNEREIENNKTLQKRKNLYDKQQQPSIESLFFKSEKKTDSADVETSAGMKTVYVCPLCFKNFKDESSQAVHMKSCAIKNNVSTKKLMVAVELQERQAAERKSLGLLSAPVLQEKKKSAPRKLTSHDEPDLQLALALSKSLYEKEEMEEWDETQMVVMSSSCPSFPDSNAEQAQKTTLQSFGFISDRNMSPANNLPVNKARKRGRPTGKTILQKRTVMERERILTERIAEILMSYADFTQRLQEEEEQSNNIKKKIVIKNQLLQQLRQTENTLWDRTRLTSTENIFYVNQLLPQITPFKKKEQKLNKEHIQDIKHTDQCANSGKFLRKKQIKKIKEIEATVDKEELMISSNAMKTCCKEKGFLDILVKSWGNILNDSSASDIIIFVKNGKHIWTHKLVFYVRCANILLDVISNDTEFSTAKEKICWIDTDYDIALAFLEFVYCGVINRNSKVLDIHTSLSSIRSLARKYKVNDLFVYLRQKEFTSNVAEANDDHNTYEKCTKSIHENVETTLSVLKVNESTFNTSLDHTRDDLKNNQCSRKALLQEDINDNIDSLEDNCTSMEEESYIPQDENILIKSPDKINSRSNTPTNFEFRASPDMFDDTSDMMKYNDATISSKEHENSNIHMLLSLIKQDADADICSQKSPIRKTQNAESAEDTVVCSKNIEQNVIEIDSESDSESNSIKPSIGNPQKNSSSSIPQNNKLNISKQKSNLTLFIEKIQKENAKSDSDLDIDSDIECTVQTSPVKHKNPFHIDKCISEDFQSDNVEQPTEKNTEKKPDRLTIMEQCIQSYANKNPEFYSHLSNEHENVKQTDTLPSISASPKTMIESSCNDTLNYTKNFISPTKKANNFTEQITITPLSCSLPIRTSSQSSNETISDEDINETEMSMYSKYMKDHRDNSIAKYRAGIRKNVSDSDLPNKSTLSNNSLNESNDIDEHENDEVLTQKDADIIVSSDTEIESISSSVSCPVLQNEDDDYENPVQQSKKSTENSRQNIEYEENNQSTSVPKAMMTNLEEQRDNNRIIGSDQDKVNSSSGSKFDNVNLNVSFTQKKSRLNKSRDNQEGFISNSITFSSSDSLNVENQFSDDELCVEFISESTNSCKKSSIEKSIEYSVNFEDDIYLANVDVDKYEKQVIEKSQSTSVLNVTEFKKNNAQRYNKNNKNNYDNIKASSSIADDITSGNDRNITCLTQDSTTIRKLKKKSLSEGQLDMNKKKSRNQEITFKHISQQLQCNYSQNIGNAKAVPKIFDKDVTPMPDYNRISTPELHKEMKKYGLKIQKRSRAVKLLSHIYDELHPLIPTTEVITEQKITEILSDEDDGPPLKKRNTGDNYVEKSNNMEDNDDELLCSQDSDKSIQSLKVSKVSKEMEFYETESLPLKNSSDITEAFKKLINLDEDLYNKILQYEPVDIEKLRSTLRTNGFKCKLPNLMSFLDEQCITFYVPDQSSKSRIHRKKKSTHE